MPTAPHTPRQQLEALAQAYHHLEAEHGREGQGGSWRRRLEKRVSHLESQFETLLDRWVREPGEQRAWRDYLHHRGTAPETPAERPPLLFKGRTETGSRITLFETLAGEDVAVYVDGRLQQRLGTNLHPQGDAARAVLPVGDQRYHEVFDAPEPALDALVAHVDAPGEPPWAWATELLDDGLIDYDFSLTDRGRRLVARRRSA